MTESSEPAPRLTGAITQARRLVAAMAHDIAELRLALDVALTLIATGRAEEAERYLTAVLASDPTDAQQDAS